MSYHSTQHLIGELMRHTVRCTDDGFWHTAIDIKNRLLDLEAAVASTTQPADSNEVAST